MSIYVGPGELYFGSEPGAIKCLLGTCVVIMLWHPSRCLGCLAHVVYGEKFSEGINELFHEETRVSRRRFSRRLERRRWPRQWGAINLKNLRDWRRSNKESTLAFYARQAVDLLVAEVVNAGCRPGQFLCRLVAMDYHRMKTDIAAAVTEATVRYLLCYLKLDFGLIFRRSCIFLS